MSIMRIITCDRVCPVYIGYPLEKTGKKLLGKKYGKKVLLLSDSNVYPLYGDRLVRSLSSESKEVFNMTLPAGEKTKNFENLIRIIEWCAEKKMGRDDTLITLGGGMVSDIGGFASSIYMRGINFVCAPTSLLSQVDASIGGKTAVNLPCGKNLAGSFYQPSLVVIDLETISTLPAREFNQGVAEIIKYGVIRSSAIFRMMEKGGPLRNEEIKYLVGESIRIKKYCVERDEKERKGLREILNFGHTLGHAVEISGFPSFSHGESVAAGMVGETYLSFRLGICDRITYERIKNAVASWNLPYSLKNMNIEKALTFLQYDKKVRQGKIRFVMPRKISSVKRGVTLTVGDAWKILREIC